jgi:hypothetical protein
LNLRARFLVGQAVHGTGMDIILTADLNQGGTPLTNDASHPVTVTVDIEKPEQGMGTFLSTTQPDTCDQTVPRLPGIKVSDNTPIFSTQQVAGARASATTPSQTGDPSSPYMTLAANLLDACGMETLPRNVIASVQLHDDGTNGDVTANDGVYTLQFQNTEYEGSYVFRFNASGTTLGGNGFSRTKASAEYVRVEVEPASSQTGSEQIAQNGSIITQVYYVVPRDQFGGYMGPGRLSHVEFSISGAQAIGNVLDFNNGMYGQVVQYDSNNGDPNVVPVVQGKPIGVGGPTPGNFWELYCLWIILCLILVILILLWLLILCRLRKH